MVKPNFWFDPITVADRLRWARYHYQEDPTQPRDLADLMLRAAESLEQTVPKVWRVIAVTEAIVIIVLASILGSL